MAEKFSNHPKILELLRNHEIGFHSSAHSVRPITPEYTDIKSYSQAYSVSLERETAHINPLTGKTEGKSGIHLLQDLFYPKKIEAYRALGMSWTPPHLEALADLGIKYDFSFNVTTSELVHYKKSLSILTFLRNNGMARDSTISVFYLLSSGAKSRFSICTQLYM